MMFQKSVWFVMFSIILMSFIEVKAEDMQQPLSGKAIDEETALQQTEDMVHAFFEALLSSDYGQAVDHFWLDDELLQDADRQTMVNVVSDYYTSEENAFDTYKISTLNVIDNNRVYVAIDLFSGKNVKNTEHYVAVHTQEGWKLSVSEYRVYMDEYLENETDQHGKTAQEKIDMYYQALIDGNLGEAADQLYVDKDRDTLIKELEERYFEDDRFMVNYEIKNVRSEKDYYVYSVDFTRSVPGLIDRFEHTRDEEIYLKNDGQWLLTLDPEFFPANNPTTPASGSDVPHPGWLAIFIVGTFLVGLIIVAVLFLMSFLRALFRIPKKMKSKTYQESIAPYTNRKYKTPPAWNQKGNPVMTVKGTIYRKPEELALDDSHLDGNNRSEPDESAWPESSSSSSSYSSASSTPSIDDDFDSYGRRVLK